MPVNDKPLISEYNLVQAKVANVLGTGSATYGYGQLLRSAPIGVGRKIKASDWENIKSDIASIVRHQNGGSSALSSVQQGSKIRWAADQPMFTYDDRINEITSTRFQLWTSSAQTVNKGSASRTGVWNTQSRVVETVTFTTANNARYFFNSGGLIRLSSSRTGGTAHPQNTSWSNILATVGTVSFGAITSTLKTYYQLTSTYQTIYEYAPTVVYGYYNNIFRIEAKCDVANNSTGTARILYFQVTWIDGSHPGADSVDGTLSVSSNTLEATGTLIPSGTFTVQSPTVAFSAFTAS